MTDTATTTDARVDEDDPFAIFGGGADDESEADRDPDPTAVRDRPAVDHPFDLNPLGDHEGHHVVRSSVTMPNIGGGLRDALKVAPIRKAAKDNDPTGTLDDPDNGAAAAKAALDACNGDTTDDVDSYDEHDDDSYPDE